MINKNILLSDKNKSIIWNVLYNNNVFYNIDNNNKNDIISIIDNSIKSFHKNLIKNEIDIIQVNKLIIKDIIDKVSKLKKNSIINDVEIAKDDLNSVLSIKKPEEINFKDDSNDEIIDNENLSDILNKMMEQRNTDEKKIFGNNIIDISYIDNNNLDMNESKSIIIKDISNIINMYDSSNNNLFINNEYDKEKKFNTNSKIDYIIQLLKNINTNQEKILEKLEK
tara:strand:- start:31983 stop:32654 length:672 start_codon:yes stop_codon:yes gene_type:complete